MGAVDYSGAGYTEVLRAKIRVFAELYRRPGSWRRLNTELEDRVPGSNIGLEQFDGQVVESEQRRAWPIHRKMVILGLGLWHMAIDVDEGNLDLLESTRVAF